MLGQFFLLANLDSMWTGAACVLVACGVESSLAIGRNNKEACLYLELHPVI